MSSFSVKAEIISSCSRGTLKVVGEINIMGATFVYDAGDVNGQFKIWWAKILITLSKINV